MSHGAFLCVPWLMYMCAETHLCVCHDSCICVPWLICVFDMRVFGAPTMNQCITNELCHTYERVMSHTCIWMNKSWMSHVMHMNESCHVNAFEYMSHEWVMSHIWTSHATYMHADKWVAIEFCHTYERVMSHTCSFGAPWGYFGFPSQDLLIGVCLCIHECVYLYVCRTWFTPERFMSDSPDNLCHEQYVSRTTKVTNCMIQDYWVTKDNIRTKTRRVFRGKRKHKRALQSTKERSR